MTSQVVLSRIQNRRGTQVQFNALYTSLNPLANEQQLQPGEIGVCTDTGRMFMGTELNIFPIPNSYIEILSNSTPLVITGQISFTPLIVTLAPVGTFTTISSLAINLGLYTSGNIGFYEILYNVYELPPAMSSPPFSRSGVLNLSTSTSYATLTDTSTDINPTSSDISFQAVYSGGSVEIQYQHNFTGDVVLSTSTILWAPF